MDGKQQVIVFGPFRLHRHTRQLCHGTTPVRLGGRAIDLLFVLVERAGQVVSRAELERLVWPGSLIEDSCLRVHIASLRRALGDDAGESRYIANVPGRGYSFVATLTSVGEDEWDAPADRPNTPRPLPVRMTSTIGRDEVMRQLCQQLARCRLTTIVGHGGIGKTTLALAIAAELQQDYADGACFVDLAQLGGGGLVPDALASTLRIAVPGESVMLTLERWLAPRRMLIVFDNCEHLIEAATRLVEWILQTAPGVDVVATSREPLDADGEWVHRLEPLECPPDDPALSVERAMDYPALRLLAERAAASMDSFHLRAAELPAAVQLCRRLDGVPLALEFAAARIGLLGVHGVVEQLDDRLRLLGSGRRTVLPRHRTLRALLDWSYDLLGPAEQAVFRACSVFTGPFTLDSAVAVATGPENDAAEVARCVLSLVAKSLFMADTRGPDGYFAVLGITRAYAIERLDDDPMRAEVARRHACHTVALMDDCEASWETLDQSTWLERASYVVGNVRSALDWAFGPDGDREIGVRLTATSTLLLSGIVSEPEMCRHATRALDAAAAGVAIDPLDEVRLQSVLAIAAIPGDETGRGPGSVTDWTSFERAIEHGERSGAPIVLIEALYNTFARCFGAAHYRQADAHAARMFDVAGQAGNPRALLVARRMRALTSHMLGMHGQARTLAEEVLGARLWKLPLRLTSPMDRGVSMRIVLARTMWIQGHGEKAAAIAQECIERAAKDRAAFSQANALAVCAIPVALWRGDDGGARALVEQLTAHTDRHAMSYWSAWAQLYRRVLIARSSQPEDLSGIALGLDAKQADHFATFATSLVTERAMLRCQQGMVGWCAPEVLRASGEQLLVRAAAGPGLDAREGDETAAGAQAEELFLRGLALARQQAARAWELRCATSLGRLWQARGQAGRAQALLEPIVGAYREDLSSADMRAAMQLLG
ncbi:helix-turn-helix transcriptional regulator [Massilia sp. IC2-477]|uniref:ATP-binding protein n=1 Tax=Massilia sp. IC2-477 TaxID=2887198 RepID=UPI001D105DAA|nr:winged helix-turn-helix domain-containing protein [Massilia sp. IC2-477]MCC2957556.1 helix-turn-helix transcriptional regulator [Massilia sp. IC2-477]